MVVELAELATIIAGADALRPLVRTKRRHGRNAGLHAGSNRVAGLAVNDDLVAGADVGRIGIPGKVWASMMYMVFGKGS